MGLTDNREKFFASDYAAKESDMIAHVGAQDAPWYPNRDCTECVWSEHDGRILIAMGTSFWVSARCEKVYRGEHLSMALVTSRCSPIGGWRAFLSNEKEFK